MDNQLNYIIELANEYKKFISQPEYLLEKINSLPLIQVEQIYKEYGDPDSKFQPTNALRADLAKLLLNGKKITVEDIENIKNNIRSKNTEYFKYLSVRQLEELKNYPVGAKDMFTNWQKLWRIFHTFIFRDEVKETTQIYLDQICKQLIIDLSLTDYEYHYVDFYGSNKIGTDYCWLALFPIEKENHKYAYQFFVRISKNIEVGRMAGHEIKNAQADILNNVTNYSSCLEFLLKVKSDIIKLNNTTRNYFKFAPGSQATEWMNFYSNGIAAISYVGSVGFDLSNINSQQELNEKMGLPSDSDSNILWG